MFSKYFRWMTAIAYDIAATGIALLVALRLYGGIHFDELVSYTLIVWPVILVCCFYLLRIYNVLWRFSQYREILTIYFASGLALVLLYISQIAFFQKGFAVPVYTTAVMLECILISVGRLVLKMIFTTIDSSKRPSASPTSDLSGNIMIIGGGAAGVTIMNEIKATLYTKSYKIKCIIDDDPYKKGNYINRVRIIGGRDQILSAAKKLNITMIVFAIPSCPSDEKSEILKICQQTGCELRIIPAIYKLIGKIEAQSLRKVEIEDLLGRDAVKMSLSSVMNYVEDKIVLVTGGGGSIGSELCRQLAVYSPRQLIIFDVYENNAYDIQNELRQNFPEIDLITLIGSVRDAKRLDSIFAKYRPQIVYHAAAHKHVPLMEYNPNESIKNNVFGTYNTAVCADRYGAERFVMISTDKAVNPTNIMGASKRICEMIVQSFNNHSKTEFVAVRFGNVLGSNGSVIPLFKKQIELGGPVTVTDPNIIRYFMTIPEAVSLVLQAGACAMGGEIFVLDMGKPVKILTLAENLIRLSGFTPHKDIKIEFTGLRPGEKLYEELLMSEEGMRATDNNLIHIGKPIEMDEKEFQATLDEMRDEIELNDCANIRHLVKRLVPTYNYVQNDE